MRVAVIQSNYFPWRGYFSIIASVDLFIFHDDLQFTKSDWRNRNIFLRNGEKVWLTAPCGTSEDRLISDVLFTEENWEDDHYKKLCNWYRKSLNFDKYGYLIEEIYRLNQFKYLSEFNQYWTKYISREILGLKTEFQDSRNFHLTGRRTDRLIDLIQQVGATRYLSGPAGKNYLEETTFQEKGIMLEYADYEKLPKRESGQNELSILHDLFSTRDISCEIGQL